MNIEKEISEVVGLFSEIQNQGLPNGNQKQDAENSQLFYSEEKLTNREIKLNTNNYSKVDSIDPEEDDNFKNKKNKPKYFFQNILKRTDLTAFFFFLFSVYLYVLSLEGCHDNQSFCLVNLNPQFFHKLMFYLMTAGFINSFIIFLIVKSKIIKFHLVYLIPTFTYLLYVHDTGADLAYHGAYNREVFQLSILLFLVLIFLMNSLLKLIQKGFFKIVFILFACGIVFTVILNYKLNTSCERWNLGLNGAKLDNDLTKNKCAIVEPRHCWTEILDGVLDISWMLSEQCDKFRYGERAELMKYLPNKYHESNKIAYPITTKWNFTKPEFFWGKENFLTRVYERMVDLEKTQVDLNGDKPEIILNFDNQTKLANVEIEIIKNETLIKERRELSKKTPLPITNNILFVYVDSISRPHFLRKMKKTSAWIEKYIKKNNDQNPGESESSHLAYQFMKYHAFIYFTQLNINPMFYGQSMYNKNGTHLIRHLKKKGFITGQSNNICARELYDVEDGYVDNVDWESFDHENAALFCDPNFYNPENPFTPYMGPYSIKKRCLYGRNTFEYVLEYGEKFWKTYLNERKFLRVGFQDAHEGTGEVARYLDEELSQFLERFEKNGWLEDTTVFFVSDHGNNMIGFYNLYNCEDFIMEKTLASLFMLLPKEKVNKNFHDIMKNNEQVMVTPYDIYNTLLNFVDMKHENQFYSKYGKSLFDKISGLERSCENYKLDLSDLWCRCR
jgi:hypothetical protein